MLRTLRGRALVAVGGVALISALVATVSHSLTGTAPAYPAEDFSTDTAWVVTRILAGDSVEIDRGGVAERVGLVGVNDQGARSREASEGEAQGNAARLTRDLLLGEAVYLRRVPAAGPLNGGSPAYVYRAPDGLFVNLELIRQGYASADARADHALDALFAKYERRARSSGRGLWGADVHDATPRPTTVSATNRPERTIRTISTDPAEITVYMTKTGKKYHTATCKMLRRSKMPSTLAAARLKLTPCSKCSPPK
jgi:micrococcal nuclease